MATPALKTQSLHFPNANDALAIWSPAGSHADDIVAALNVTSYKAVILILGAAANIDETLLPRLTQLFGRGIARAAAEANAVIIDGGTQAGVMALMGEAVAGCGYKTPLIGVAPASQVVLPGDSTAGVQLEAHHSHFVLVEADGWGSETPTLFAVAGALAGGTDRTPRQQGAEPPTRHVPMLAILVGGGQVSRDEVLRAVRHGLPVVVVEGSGGLADELAAGWQQRETLPDDPLMAEIIADGELHVHLLTASVKAIERLIIRDLGIDKVLMQAWESFADYDLNATLQQKRYSAMQLAILMLGVFATALAIGQQIFLPTPDLQEKSPGVSKIVHFTLIILPILLTVLITAASRFKQGSKWLLLRAGAESIKREIYRYRTRAMSYKEQPEQQLSQRVEDITRRTMRTEVNSSALIPYNKDKGFPPYMYAAHGGDDGFTYLTPDRYVEVRLGDQLHYFRTKAVYLEWQVKMLSWMTFIIGGVGTFLAAIDQQAWIALTTAIVVAIGTYLGYRQTESTLTKYNQAATDLANVKGWWNALSAEEQSAQQNIDSLVEHTEQVLQSELDGWVQQMQNALAEMRKEQPTAPEKEENREPQEPHAAPPPGPSTDKPANGQDTPPPEGAAGNPQPAGGNG